MSLKSWVIGRTRRGLLSRVDLPPRDTQFEPGLTGEAASTAPHALNATNALNAPNAPNAPNARLIEPALPPAAHLGAYAPLIAAIRAELEHFIVSQLQLHLAIADRDRFVMTSIAVHCRGADAARERLRQFRREFKPEQIKRYLLREVIAGLPNAAALDLSQFAGLADAEAEADGDDYADLLAELEGPAADAPEPVYEIELVGRWTESDGGAAARAHTSPVVALRTGQAHARGQAQGPDGDTGVSHATQGSHAMPATPPTPLAGGLRAEFEIDDAQGPRRITLHAVQPGRRYLVGQQPGCDIVVQGTYTSRRHAQLWFNQGSWWVADAGSTNGIRVDAGMDAGLKPGPNVASNGGPGDAGALQALESGDAPLRLPAGAQLVLSARSEGPATDHPRLRLVAPPAAVLTPIAEPLSKRAGAAGPLQPARGAAQGTLAMDVSDLAADSAPAARLSQSNPHPHPHPQPQPQPPIMLSPIFPHRPAPEAPATPLTAVRGAAPGFVVRSPSGGSLRAQAAALPLAIGRSRNQALVIDRRHLGVSGRHLEIVALDAEGLSLQVHGDNGVLVDGRHHRAGSRLQWRPGQTLVLGNAADEADACVLQLARDGAQA